MAKKGIKARISGSQRAARKRNIKVAQQAAKRGGRSKPGSARHKAGKAFAAGYKAARRKGASKAKARFKGAQYATMKSPLGSSKMIKTLGGSMSLRKKFGRSNISGKPTAKKSSKEFYRGTVSAYQRGDWKGAGRQSVNWFSK